MKVNGFKKIATTETGQALPIALVLLLLGSFLVVPSLSFMTTSLNYNRTMEEYDARLYAADAGVQDAIWKLAYGGLDPAEEPEWQLAEQVNGATVHVQVVSEGDSVYRLISTATDEKGRSTAVECYFERIGSYASLFEHAITSPGDVNLQPGNTVYGGVYCGGEFSGNEGDVKTGGIHEGQTVVMPSEEELTAFYSQRVDKNNPYPSSTYTVSGGTVDNPVLIPPLYRKGDLKIVGSGYARLTGTVFIDLADDGSGGRFDFSDKDITLDLNGQTIYARYYGNCSGDAIYFGPNTTVIGPGCIIGVGNVNFQPQTGQGDKLIGAADTDTGSLTESGNRFLLQRFEATQSGTLSTIQVKCYITDPDNPPHLKVALYSADGSNGGPGTLRTCSDTVTVDLLETAWFPVDVPDYQVSKNTKYWLAAIADAAVICREAATDSYSRYQDVPDFNSFIFPSPPSGAFITPAPKYQIRGFSGGQEFIMLMSVRCTVNLQPWGSLYGCIVGNTNVNLQPHCFINLVGVPEDGLDFPMQGGQGGGSTTATVRLRSYSIR